MALPQAGERFADYLLEEVLGSGELAVVFRALDPHADEQVAIKVYRQSTSEEGELARRFSSDRRTIVLEHANLVRVLDTGIENGHAYLVMRLVDGPSLRAVLQERGHLEPTLAAQIVAQVAGALDTVHATGLVHRNVAPDNILLEADLEHPHAYLSDFALARDVSLDRATNVGILLGSTAYFAPERVIGVEEIDARADVYSLGCVLFEALTGSPPFGDGTAVAGLLRRTSEPPPLVSAAAPGLAKAWDGVIEGALATEPDDRFATAGELGQAALAAAG